MRIVGLAAAVLVAGLQFARADEPAKQPARLRVLTYNIHHGEGTDRKLDLERIAAIIRGVEPDLVALQEVDQTARRSGTVDQPAELARLTGLRVAFGGNISLEGGQYGNAVLSRYPIRRQQNHPLPSLGAGEKRGVLEVEVELPGGEPLVFFATHLDHRRPDAERVASAEAINKLVEVSNKRSVLAGDLNAVPESPTLSVFRRQWSVFSEQPLLTSPAALPVRQIDYVLPRSESGLRVVEARVVDEAVASDHRPLLVTLEWDAPP